MEAGKLIIRTIEGAVDINTAENSVNTIGTAGYTVFIGDGSQLSGISIGSRLINTTAPLTGGGDLSADRTLSINAASGSGAGSMSASHYTLVNNATDANTPSTIVKRASDGTIICTQLQADVISAGVTLSSFGNIEAVTDISAGGSISGGSINGDSINGFYFHNPVISTGNTPPGSPANGQRYLVGSAGTGAWTGLSDQIVCYDVSLNPNVQTKAIGSTVYVQSTLKYLYWNGTAWTEQPLHAGTSASRALVTDSNKKIIDSSVTATELGYLSGVTSSIQTQINSISGGGVTTGRTINTTAPLTGGGDLSADRTLAINAASGAAAGSMSAAHYTLVNNATDQNLVSTIVMRDSGGIVTVTTLQADNVSADVVYGTQVQGLSFNSTSNTEIGYLIGVTSAIQTQLNARQPLDTGLTNYATGSDFVVFTGPTTSAKTFTLPDATCTILTTNAAVTTTQGGTGLSSVTANRILYATGSNTWGTDSSFTYSGAAFNVGWTTITQPTLGSAAFIIQSTATNDDVAESVYQNRITTTDATPTVLHNITVVSSAVVYISAVVIAHRTGGSSGSTDDSAAYEIKGTYKNSGLGAVLIGSVYSLENESQSGWSATLVANSTIVNLVVTGAADNNIVWHATIRVYQVST